MNTILFYDTETTGLPDWQAPSGAEHQPHLVQLAAILVDADTRKEIASIDFIVNAEVEIPEDVSAIHGITTEIAKQGFYESFVVNLFFDLWEGFPVSRVAHNKVFDQRIMRIAAKRHCHESVSESWADKDSHHCTMRMYQKKFGGKQAKLVDAYKHATGKELENAHSAMADTRACMAVYFWLLDLEKETAEEPANNPFEMKGQTNVG